MRSKKGYELAARLSPMVPDITINELAEICSKICRIAVTLHRIQERQCSEEMSEKEYARLDKQEESLTKVVLSHANKISKDIKVIINGDPRGATIKLELPDPWKRLHDCFGNEGVCVP